MRWLECYLFAAKLSDHPDDHIADCFAAIDREESNERNTKDEKCSNHHSKDKPK